MRPVGTVSLGREEGSSTVDGEFPGQRGLARPSGTDRMVYGIPGNKLSGYDHDVPTGPSPTGPAGTKTTLTPVRISTPHHPTLSRTRTTTRTRTINALGAGALCS